MAKEQERDELHRTIWQIANDLRGSVDGWDFKSYVLGMLFYRFISENLSSYLNIEEQRTGNTNFDYANISDKDAEFGRADTVTEKGFYILPSELFVNIRKRAKTDENLNETLSRVFKNIENSAKGTDSEDDLKGLFDDIDVNSNKLGGTVQRRNDQLIKIINAIGDLKLGNFQENTIDAFGDAYEFLMTMYASNAGKSGGEFFTPQEVSELLAEIAVVGKKQVNKVYDPACGSGSLLLKFAKVLGKENVRQGFYGQEVNISTFNLCRINMFLHDINYEKFDIAHGNTLIDPKHWDDEPFDAIVSNPPYSIKWEGDVNPLLINDPRFSPAGVLAPKSKADLAFTMHMLHWLSTSGTAAIVEFPGVLYRGGAEQKIRKYLIDENYIDAVIQLPPDLFFGTTIGTCIVVLKKSKKDNATLFIDASAEFVRNGNKNKLSDTNRKKILNAYIERKDDNHFAKLVLNKDIADNDYNIAVTSYVEGENTAEEVNIEKLNAHIAEIVIKQNKVRGAIDEIIEELQGVSKIDELLQQYCPHGVEYEKLGEVVKILRGKRLTKNQLADNEKYPVYHGGLEPLGYYGQSNRNANTVMVINVGASAGTVGYSHVDFWSSDGCFCISHSDQLISRYVYYALLAQENILKSKVRVAGIPTLDAPVVENIRIPTPPLEVQKEIVIRLDMFTLSETELEAELEARKKQYKYYRLKLLNFQSLSNG